MDSVGKDTVLVAQDASPLVFATVCLLFWSEQTGRRGTTVWLVCAEMVSEAAIGVFLTSCPEWEIEKSPEW